MFIMQLPTIIIVSSKYIFRFGLTIFSVAINTPIAIGKSNIEPSFLLFAGERFTTIFLLGKSSDEFLIAVFMRSFHSFLY